MRSPTVVLENLQRKSQDPKYQFERLYRNLYNPDFYLLAYQGLYANKGAMTEGVDRLTLDGTGDKRIAKLISNLKDRSYQPNPARRHYIPKSGGTSKRPLGIPSAEDKLVQEVVRLMLESIYEPSFLHVSHGFRPKRSCHTALSQVQKTYTGVKWFVEGDIKSFFDTIDHHVLVKLLKRRIADEALIDLIWKFLKAGYLEDWTFHSTYSGTPQGSGISPLLANIYLHELDCFMESLKETFDKGKKRNCDANYGRTHSTHQRFRATCTAKWDTMTAIEKKEAAQEAKRLRREFQQYPSLDPMDNHYRRIQYVRYADDFLVGIIGGKKDAEEVKTLIGEFLHSHLKLVLSPEKTLITHASQYARFLGYDINLSSRAITCKTSKGQERVHTNRVRLVVPKEKWMNKLLKYGVLRIQADTKGKERWMPVACTHLMGLEPQAIVASYNAQIRGLYNYYCLANNASVLNKFYYVMEYSMYKTLAGKFNTTMAHIISRFSQNGEFVIPYQTRKGIRYAKFHKGSFAMKKAPMDSTVDWNVSDSIRPQGIYKRFKAGACEMCGKVGSALVIHQVKRLKDLSGLVGWERLMLEKRRKTLVVCEDCHGTIHKTL